ncbi:MAG: RNA polymerase subunit sigma [Rhodospirillales bacterium CG15_BIG_FIL_POST_REV_8_21_14_020_66_15]|nr:MAG: RNA polymerase subunit sigma [Rhodospirillales bacterium CG15_BIG_FIL_POST_REV_8_21_14_020_66_15]
MHTAGKQDHKDVTMTPAVVERARAGDHAAFEAVMRAHNRLLYRFVRNLVPSDADAEDVIQETYVKAFRSIAGFDGRARLSTWLIRIALNEVHNRGRKTRMTEPLDTVENVISMAAHLRPSGGLVPRATTPEQAAARAQIRRYLEAAIARLPEEFRTVFVLRGIEEFSVEETAETLDIPAATVKTRFHRARARLRDLLDRDVHAALQDTHPFAGARCDRIVSRVLDRLTARPD